MPMANCGGRRRRGAVGGGDVRVKTGKACRWRDMEKSFVPAAINLPRRLFTASLADYQGRAAGSSGGGVAEAAVRVVLSLWNTG